MSFFDKIIIGYLTKNAGFDRKRAEYYLNHIKVDWKDKNISFRDKVWAIRRGFYPSRVDLYKLTNDNYKAFLSDYDYRRSHPLNNHFAFWINDKLTLKYVLGSFEKGQNHSSYRLPKYYLYIENDGFYSYLMDAPVEIEHNQDFILNLLKSERVLALKPNHGQAGEGFIKLEYDEGRIILNSREITLDEYKALLPSLNGYIVTEYISQHDALKSIWGECECSVRVIALRKHEDDKKYSEREMHVVFSYARFGTSLSGTTSNLYSGGVAAFFDINTGEYMDLFFREKQFSGDGSMILPSHPDSGYVLKGKKLPLWQDLKNAVNEICTQLSSLEYFGFDFFITNEGIVLCEINSLPGIDSEQIVLGPMLKDKEFKRFLDYKLQAK